MSVVVGDRTYRTLSHPIYLGDGRQVKEVWQDGRKVYPDLPRFAYVLKLAGKINITYNYAKELKWSFGGVLSDGDTYEVVSSMAHMASSVEMTVLSDDPIEVYEHDDIWTYPSGGDPRSWYHSGETMPIKMWNGHGMDDPKVPKIRVLEFPKPIASYAFRCPVSSPCQKAGGDYTTCENRTHVMLKTSSSNSAVPKDGLALGALAWCHFEKPLSTLMLSTANGRVITREYHPEYESGLNFRSGSGSGSIRTAEVRCMTEEMRGQSTCGFVQYVSLPVNVNGAGVIPYKTEHDHLFSYLPFNELIYNNNPPVTSPTFSTDPPTEEVPESILATL